MQPYYPSKILILGEYAVLSGSSFLAIPYKGFRSLWSKEDKVDDRLLKYCDFVEKGEFSYIDVSRMRAEVEKGIQLHTTIPLGYGAGSSGSLVAAVYDRYGGLSVDLLELQLRLAHLEAYFHGQSSGIDPLVCYLNKSLGSSNGEINVHENISLDDSWFLLDSGDSRSTEKLIEVFKWKIKSEEFRKYLKTLVDFNNQLYTAIMNSDPLLTQRAMKNISIWQLRNFQEMIPDAIERLWQKGLATDTFYLKLCGAGGGGFFLCYDMGGAELTSSFILRPLS